MAIRLPYKTIIESTDTGDLGGSSVSGVVATEFDIPQDCDGVVVKFTASVAGAGMSATLQTTDDAGTTWYDIVQSSVVSAAGNDTAEWLTGSTIVDSKAVGAATALAGTTGLPILGKRGRVVLEHAGDTTVNDLAKIVVSTGHQSATA